MNDTREAARSRALSRRVRARAIAAADALPGWRALLLLGLACAAVLLWSRPAHALVHLARIQEMSTRVDGDPVRQFVEIRMLETFDPPLSGSNRCTPAIDIEVPLRQKGGRTRKAQVVLKVKHAGSIAGKRKSDKDGLRLVCKPS